MEKSKNDRTQKLGLEGAGQCFNQSNLFQQDLYINGIYGFYLVSILMEVSSKSPRVPPGIGWGIYQFSVPEG